MAKRVSIKNSEIINYLNSRTIEDIEKERLNRLASAEKYTSEWYLGYFVGNEVVRQLPMLSIDGNYKHRNIIEVSEEDKIIYSQLTDKLDLRNDNTINDDWNNYISFRKKLYEKYLPNPFKSYVMLIPIRNIDDFKIGLGTSLWDSDICYYNTISEKIKIYNDENCYFTIIELSL